MTSQKFLCEPKVSVARRAQQDAATASCCPTTGPAGLVGGGGTFMEGKARIWSGSAV